MKVRSLKPFALFRFFLNFFLWTNGGYAPKKERKFNLIGLVVVFGMKFFFHGGLVINCLVSLFSAIL